jgi:hypothetical protein
MKTQKELAKEIKELTKFLTLKSKVFAANEANKNADDLKYVVSELKNLNNFLGVDIAKYL